MPIQSVLLVEIVMLEGQVMVGGTTISVLTVDVLSYGETSPGGPLIVAVFVIVPVRPASTDTNIWKVMLTPEGSTGK
jgi:hypothetical protein